MSENKQMIMRRVSAELRRPLTMIEKEQIAFPKMCAVCFEWDPLKLYACEKCQTVWFCRDEPHREKQLLQVHAPKMCTKLLLFCKLVMIGNLFFSKHDSDWIRLGENN